MENTLHFQHVCNYDRKHFSRAIWLFKSTHTKGETSIHFLANHPGASIALEVEVCWTTWAVVRISSVFQLGGWHFTVSKSDDSEGKSHTPSSGVANYTRGGGGFPRVGATYPQRLPLDHDARYEVTVPESLIWHQLCVWESVNRQQSIGVMLVLVGGLVVLPNPQSSGVFSRPCLASLWYGSWVFALAATWL